MKSVMGMKERKDRIRVLREEHDLIAKVLGTTHQVYSHYAHGINELPIRHLIALCRYYGVSADFILVLSDRESQK